MIDQDYICGTPCETENWTQIKVTVKLRDLDALTAIMSMVDTNLMIEDYSDIDLKTCYGDLIDESILKADKTVGSVSVYVPDTRPFAEDLSFIRERMKEAGIEGKTEVLGIREEDWANSWKKYYKPTKIGKNIVIVPTWEPYEPGKGEKVILMEPGMAFGTGTHETTRLVIRLLETYTKPGSYMLDVGTGSGILAICGSRLGVAKCKAYDIDPTAVRVAEENVRINGLSNIECGQSDLLKQVDLSEGPYDLITANIVADIIIRMTPDIGNYLKEDGVLLLSGIIDERAVDVTSALKRHGLKVVETARDNGWTALAVQKA